MSTNLRLSPELADALREAASRSGRSQQDIVREAIAKELGLASGATAMQRAILAGIIEPPGALSRRRTDPDASERHDLSRASGSRRSVTDLYVDTSALLKRIFVEAESARVRAILRARSENGDVVASSELAWVEIARALLRAGVGDVDAALSSACNGTALQRLSPTVIDRARIIGPAHLRSLDAIHLAAAVTLGAAEILTFDRRVAEAAASLGVKAIP